MREGYADGLLTERISPVRWSTAHKETNRADKRRLIDSVFAKEIVETKFAGTGRNITDKENRRMSNVLMNLYVKFQSLKDREEGQDLVEYALLVALIALVCVAGVNNVATAVNNVFTNISSSLA